MKKRIYLDHNSTTPLDPLVLEEMLPYFTDFYGNASSRNHSFGWEAEAAVNLAREQVAGLIGCTPKELVFTSGATESINLALKGFFDESSRRHLITCEAEHKAVLDVSKKLEQNGIQVTYLPVDSGGLVNPDDLKQAISEKTGMVCIMQANNETGVLQPIELLSEIAHEHGALFMTDATQAVGKTSVNVAEMSIDLLALSAHKMYGPKGVGALFVRKKDSKIKLTSQLDGGGHERNLRSGTLNVPGIVGLGKACSIASDSMVAESKRLGDLRNELEQRLMQIPDAKINGHLDQRLPHVTNLAFEKVDGEQLILSLKNLAVSQGSACTSATFEPSHVLTAMGLTPEEAFSSIRIGLGRFNSKQEIDEAATMIQDSVTNLRKG